MKFGDITKFGVLIMIIHISPDASLEKKTPVQIGKIGDLRIEGFGGVPVVLESWVQDNFVQLNKQS